MIPEPDLINVDISSWKPPASSMKKKKKYWQKILLIQYIHIKKFHFVGYFLGYIMLLSLDPNTAPVDVQTCITSSVPFLPWMFLLFCNRMNLDFFHCSRVKSLCWKAFHFQLAPLIISSLPVLSMEAVLLSWINISISSPVDCFVLDKPTTFYISNSWKYTFLINCILLF